MSQHVDTAVEALLASVFEERPEALTDGTRRGDLDRWDSLGHLRLVAALREAFAIEIPSEEALDMETVADIKRIVRSLIADARPAWTSRDA